MGKLNKVKNFLLLNNSWNFTLDSKEITVIVTANKTIEVNGNEIPSLYNKDMGRIEFNYCDKLFYICPGNALPFFGMNVQLYMDKVNIKTGRDYHITPTYQYMIMLLTVYLLGILIGFWMLIPAAVYTFCVYFFYRHRKYIIVQLPSKLRQFQGISATSKRASTIEDNSILNYNSTNKLMTKAILPIQDIFKQIRHNETYVGTYSESTPLTMGQPQIIIHPQPQVTVHPQQQFIVHPQPQAILTAQPL